MGVRGVAQPYVPVLQGLPYLQVCHRRSRAWVCRVSDCAVQGSHRREAKGGKEGGKEEVPLVNFDHTGGLAHLAMGSNQ